MVKNPPANAGDVSLIPGEGNSNPLRYFCLRSLMDRAWQPIVHGVTKESDTTEKLNNNLTALDKACLLSFSVTLALKLPFPLLSSQQFKGLQPLVS